jgi:hypothetical protein
VETAETTVEINSVIEIPSCLELIRLEKLYEFNKCNSKQQQAGYQQTNENNSSSVMTLSKASINLLICGLPTWWRMSY